MKIKDLKNISQFNFKNIANEDIEISGVFIGDLLSWVMANGKEKQIWITVQAHLNVIAVSLLKEFSCIILCDNTSCDEEFINKCKEEQVNLILTSCSAYKCAKELINLDL